MESVFLGLVIFLFTLAVFDLTVGVSNDAVNFLSSAIGAKVASFKTILIVAGVGIFLGATTSSGMMDIARHGIFHPWMFEPMELMNIFLAVIVSDVILIDRFNSYGLPTSTTVSMVFELLGASVALSVVKMSVDPTLTFGGLLNTDKALEVITGIFVSVPIAFVFGAMVQWLSRVVFTFTYEGAMKWKIGLFGGVAATAIIYFMLMKSLKTLSFVSDGFIAFVNANTGLILAGCLVLSSIVSQVLYFLRVNVLKLLVLLGTFALAMAFAGNDLVNFIGVPLAGRAVYIGEDLSTSGSTPVLFLAAAGAIMTVALATSKKAHNVVKTSVDLTRQSGGDEMFGSSRIARVIVRMSTNTAAWLADVIPPKAREWIDSRFNVNEAKNERGAAFDEVRATINLVVASLLIALGTSLKLPLSTTYVTFMVAMGSSLADRAWGRESAVFRITGVMSVVGGWFLTAGAAFAMAFLVAMIMRIGGFVMIGIAIFLALFIVIRSNLSYSRKKEKGSDDPLFDEMMRTDDQGRAQELLEEHVRRSQGACLAYAAEAYQDVTNGFLNESVRGLYKAEDSIKRQRAEIKNARRKEMMGLRRIGTGAALSKNTSFHSGRNACENIVYCLLRICNQCQEHIGNSFTPLDEAVAKTFMPVRDTLLFLLKSEGNLISSGDYAHKQAFLEGCDSLAASLAGEVEAEAARMSSSGGDITVAYVYMNMLQESEEILLQMREVLRSSEKFSSTASAPVAPAR